MSSHQKHSRMKKILQSKKILSTLADSRDYVRPGFVLSLRLGLNQG